MILTITDKNGNNLSNLDIYFQYKDTHKIFKTNADGLMALTGLDKGAVVHCYIDENEKESFDFEENKELTIAFALATEDMLFVVARQDGEAASNLEIQFEYNGETIVSETDNTGQITLSNVPINTKVKAFQLFKGQEVNTEHFLCERDKAQYFYVAEELFEKATMKLKLVDKKNQVIKKSDLRFKLEDKEFETVTDQQGCISIENMKLGSVVECKQLIFGKSLKWHKFIFDSGTEEYIIHGESRSPDDNYESDYTTVSLKLRLVGSKSEPVANAIIVLDYAGRAHNKYTNANGEIQVDDVPIGEKVKVFVDVRGNKAEAEYICDENDETHEIVLKTDSYKLYAWLIPLILIVGMFILYSQSNTQNLFTKEKKPEPQVLVKDTVFISHYQIVVKDKKLKNTIKNAKVALVYKDTSFVKFCDAQGQAVFDTLSGIEPLSIGASFPGYYNALLHFKADSLFEVFLQKNDSVDVGLNYLDCGLLTQSEGVKSTFRTFKMKARKGRFKLFYNMFSLPDKITVYNGNVHEISGDKIIFSTKKSVAGLKTLYVNFESADSLITINVVGNDKDTKWLYKVFCPKK